MSPEDNTQSTSPIGGYAGVNTAQPQTPQTPAVKIGKFKASKMIVRESWRILRQNKGLAWFPVFSGVVSLFALVVLVAVFFFVAMAGNLDAFSGANEEDVNLVFYLGLLVYYIVMFFINNYFLAGVYIIVQGSFNGQNLSVADGISGANQNLGKIFIWSVISATVGVVLRFISDRSKWLGQLIAWLVGAAWALLTYFSLPSLVIGQRSVGASFKESAALIRKTWGETIIINFGVGLFFFVVSLVIIAFCIGMFILVPVFEMFVLVAILFVLSMVVISIISTTLGSIFKLALYQFALTGTVPAGFTPDIVRGAIKPGK